MRHLALAAAVIASLPGVAAGYDLTVQSAAVDQPRINFAVARAAAPTTPLVGQDVFGDPTIYAQAFYDTGASGTVLAESIADALGIGRQTFQGQTVVFGDAAPGGVVPFNVSEPLVIRLADNLGAGDSGLIGDPGRVAALSDPANFTTLYDEAFGPLRSQIGPLGGGGPFTGDLNVLGVPTMSGRIVSMDARPTNNFFTLLDSDPDNDTFDVQMRTRVHDRYGPIVSQPGVPTPGTAQRPELTVSLAYADFARFTTITPSGAIPPTLADNPFIGPDPTDPTGPTRDVPPVTMRHNGREASASFLLDTGAAASFVSTRLAGEIGVAYDPARPLGSASPRLTGVSPDRQFTLQISGISGDVLTVAGFFADEMLVRTDQGDAVDNDDPEHLNYGGAPVLVFDIEVFDPDADETIILDGIFGMNNLVATANVIADDLFPLFLDPTASPFELITFDQRAGKLGLSFTAGEPLVDGPDLRPEGPVNAAAYFGGTGPRGVVLTSIPEPAMAALAFGVVSLLYRRRA